MENHNGYDLNILGGGMAGLTSAIYGVRSGLLTLVPEKKSCGGLANRGLEIENFPQEGISHIPSPLDGEG